MFHKFPCYHNKKEKGHDPMKKYLRITALAVLLIFCVLWLGAIIRCEYLTNRYYDDFADAWRVNTMLGEMEYFKVLSCNGEWADVYYVGEDYSSGDLMTFCREEGQWAEAGWDTVWSDTGSASDVIWPYWWHFIYGGF